MDRTGEDPRGLTPWQRKAAALAEVVAIVIGGFILAGAIGRSLAGASIKRQMAGVAPGAVDFWDLTRNLGVQLALQYTVILSLAFWVGRWHRGRPLAAYGVTLAGRPVREHLLTGVTLFAIGSFPAHLLLLLRQYFDLGPGPDIWKILESPWDLSFWVFLFVGSYGIVPVVEELFARGYVQTRLSEDFGTGAGIVLTTLLFVFSHTQYFKASATTIGMIVCLLFFTLLLGFTRHLTGSLLPSIVAHALTNVPVRGWLEPFVLGALLLVILLRRRQVGGLLRETAHGLAGIEGKAALGVAALGLAAVLFSALLAPPLLFVLVATAAVVAASFEWREKMAAPAGSGVGLEAKQIGGK